MATHNKINTQQNQHTAKPTHNKTKSRLATRRSPTASRWGPAGAKGGFSAHFFPLKPTAYIKIYFKINSTAKIIITGLIFLSFPDTRLITT